MMKKIIKISVLVLFVILVINGCKKENNIPINPYSGKTTVLFNPNVSYGTMTDQDGNVYKTVTIGTQTWMAENLRTTKYRDGTAITDVTDNKAWRNLTTGAYGCGNYTNIPDSLATYGRLYNWYAATDSRNIAPSGWHVPTDTEWKTLEMFLGMTQEQADSIGFRGTDQGNQLKETGRTHWYWYGGTNSSGFSALPAGYRDEYFGNFWYYSESGLWWSATEFNGANAWCRCLISDYDKVSHEFSDKNYGFSVRCLRD
jgi:uncharacterized protein (TIGR02145 family)